MINYNLPKFICVQNTLVERGGNFYEGGVVMNVLITEVYENKEAFELLKNGLYVVCYQKSGERPPRRNQWGYIDDYQGPDKRPPRRNQWGYIDDYQGPEKRPPRRDQWGYIIDDSNERQKMFVKR